MFQFLRRVLLFSVLALHCDLAGAQDSDASATFIMPSCRAFVGPASREGRCSGIIEGLVFAGKGVCAPKGSTAGQAVSVVVKYIDSRPTRQQDNFIGLALEALRKTWPCKK